MTPENQVQLSYGEIMKQIMEQLNSRKMLLIGRIILTLAPLLLGIILLFVTSIIPRPSEVDALLPFPIILLLAVAIFLLFISPMWMFILGHIFKVERIIWIDSFFDKVSLTNKQSWKFAKKLFWPSLWLDLHVFFRYYLVASIVYLGAIAGYIALIVAKSIEFQILFAIIGFIIISVLLWLYVTYTAVQLRYVRFLFIDLYGTAGFTYGKIFVELKKFNIVLKQDAFRKSLVVTLGSDAVMGVANSLINVGAKGLSSLGSGGQVAGAVVQIVAGQTTEIVNDYAKQVTYYIFYQLVRKNLYGEAQVKNTAVYGIQEAVS